MCMRFVCLFVVVVCCLMLHQRTLLRCITHRCEPQVGNVAINTHPTKRMRACTASPTKTYGVCYFIKARFIAASLTYVSRKLVTLRTPLTLLKEYARACTASPTKTYGVCCFIEARSIDALCIEIKPSPTKHLWRRGSK